MNEVDVFVRYRAGAYCTNRVRNLTASSTMSAQAAARRLGEKLFGPALQHVTQVGDEVNLASAWRAVGDQQWHAWVWATGLIEFGDRIPEDACHFASGPRRALMTSVAVVARHGIGKSLGELLVPGIPEAKNQRAGMDALIAFERWLEPRNDAKDSFGVVYGRPARAALEKS